MNTPSGKKKKKKSPSVKNAVTQKRNAGDSLLRFEDSRPEVVAQQKLQGTINNSQKVKLIAQLQALANSHSARNHQPIQKKENRTGLPGNLRTGVETLSGYSMDDVRVHYNSDKPARLQAHAYTQGTDIHIAPGQDKHLPHEAWHVVQQKQGRVRPTMKMKGKVNVNDDVGLEKEADVMGGKAAAETPSNDKQALVEGNETFAGRVYQRMIYVGGRPRLPGTVSRRQAQAVVARARVSPAIEGQVMEEYDRWITDGTIRRYNRIDDAVDALIRLVRQRNRAGSRAVEPVVLNTSPSSEPANTTQVREPEQRESNLSREAPRTSSEVESPSTSGGSTNVSPEHSETSLPHDQERVRNARLGAQTLPDIDMTAESETRVGFEVEVGGHYFFPLRSEDGLDRIVNRTLVNCVIGGQVILEMLLDDIRRERDPGTGREQIVAQVEFRTPPMRFSEIRPELATDIRTAINRFPHRIFQNMRRVEFRIPNSSRRGAWVPTSLGSSQARLLGTGRTPGPFRAPTSSRLAQHATTSIELEAFTVLPEEQQRLLFPAGAGARTKQQLLDRMAERTRGDIDATAGGRNDEGITAKTPIESILAADPTLGIPVSAESGGNVTTAPTEQYTTRDVATVVEEIRNARQFPQIQGAGNQPTGYRAVAEKLQSPLRDTRSGELRVLVEHRTQGLVNAVNAALENSRTRSGLRNIERAATAMDAQRLFSNAPLAYALSRGLHGGPAITTTSPETDTSIRSQETSGTSSREGAGGGGRPAIAAPAHPLNLAALCYHYHQGIAWAQHHGTFSAEFHQFRDHPLPAFNLLVHAGLNQDVADQLQAALPGIIAENHAQQDYIDAEIQERIFDALNLIYGRQLWALLRYLNAGQG